MSVNSKVTPYTHPTAQPERHSTRLPTPATDPGPAVPSLHVHLMTHSNLRSKFPTAVILSSSSSIPKLTIGHATEDASAYSGLAHKCLSSYLF